MGLAITSINMATLGTTPLRCQGKTRLPSKQRRGSTIRELPREAVETRVANGAALVARAGTAERVSEISGAEVGSQVGTGLMGRALGSRA